MREFSAFLFQCVVKCVAKTKKVTFRKPLKVTYIKWLRELDLNQRPSGYEPDELPDCSIPRYFCILRNLLFLLTFLLLIAEK